LSRAQSTEALARRAVQVRADDDACLREAYGEVAVQPRRPLDDELPSFKARFAALTPRVLDRERADGVEGGPDDDARVVEAVLDAGRAERVLMAEAVVSLGCARSVSGHRKHRLESKGGQSGVPTLAPSALRRRLRLAREGGVRRALVEVIEKAEDDDRKPAIQMVDSLRGADDALGGGLLASIGWVSTDARALAEAVLAMTEDPYAELRRARIHAVLGRGARATVLAEHGALSRSERADDAMPLPDREGIASRWCERIHLGLPRLVGGVPAPALGHPLQLLASDPEASARAIGAPAPDAHGVLELMTLVGELLTLRTAGAGPIADALGVSRLHGVSIATLARHLALRPSFLQREAAIDRSRIEDVLRELLYVELERLRTLAAETLALSDALERTPGLGERVAETFGKALGFDCAPRHAPHRVCDAWHAQAPRWLEGAVHASALSHVLVEQHDEDWFRNPRAGATLRAALDVMRTLGPPPPDLDALGRQLADAYRAARA
jgi:hypothetical protein